MRQQGEARSECLGQKDVLQKASASPDGEKATSWTQPPESEPYSPQTALNGSLDPQMLACGL